MRSLVVLSLSVAALVSGCASTTVINSQPPGAHLLVDGAQVGDTPYTYTETVSAFTHHMVTLRKAGYQDANGSISADQWQVGKVVLSVICFIPGLIWSTEYPPAYNFVLQPGHHGHQNDESLAPVYDPDHLISQK